MKFIIFHVSNLNLLKNSCKTNYHLNGAHNHHNIAIVINVICFNFAQTNNHHPSIHHYYYHNSHRLNNMRVDNIRENVVVTTLPSTNNSGSIPFGNEPIASNAQSSNERSVCANGLTIATELKNCLMPRHRILVAEECAKLQTLSGLVCSSCVLINSSNNDFDRNSNGKSDNSNDKEEEATHLGTSEIASMPLTPSWLELSTVKQESHSLSNKRTNENTTNV